ncbi:MAG: HAD family hydrolase [Desulfovibrio sp.]|jgi:phosphoglycolate phosphatase|nr:HAD family hydrolase [Desulfovibrio sp.]
MSNEQRRPCAAIIFDLDGTLDDLAAAANAALRIFGYPPHPPAAYQRMVGNGVSTLISRALPAGEREKVGEEGLVALTRTMRGIYADKALQTTRPYPGVCELLAVVRDMDIKSGVLSNKPDAETRLIISHFFSDHPFTAVQGALPDVPLKPDPTAALSMAAAFALPPAQILYLGDSDVDIRTAKAAGMYAVGAAWGFRGKEELLLSGADAVCAEALEVVKLLGA